MEGLRKKGMAAAFCKDCDSGFLSSGRRVVDQKHRKTCLYQSMEGEAVDITRIRVPPRPPENKADRFVCFIFSTDKLSPWIRC